MRVPEFKTLEYNNDSELICRYIRMYKLGEWAPHEVELKTC